MSEAKNLATTMALIRLEPTRERAREASDAILAALRDNAMHKGETAKALGCAHGTLLGWIALLGLADKIARLEERSIAEGWHHGRLGGRPRKPKAKGSRRARAAT